uniref:Uncharacterized protein n=1 Tax=Arundo donax TaxID=35708 RepID=A0A0A9F120_ARUDO
MPSRPRPLLPRCCYYYY